MEIKKSEFRENVEAFAIAVLTILFVIIFIFQSFLVKGTSMEPTLHEGERLIVNKFIYRFRTPVTGDIIVLKPPQDPTVKYIKRVIAGPGQSIYVHDSITYVDGVAIKEPYIKEKKFDDFQYQSVPDDKLFVMGDNRNGSKDSREIGYIPLKNVVGRAVLVFWPPLDAKVLFRPKYKSATSEVPAQSFTLPFQHN